MRTIRAALGAALLASSAASAVAGPMACEREMMRAAAATGVPLNVLYSVGLTETGRRGQLEPYDLNIDGREVRSDSLAEAMARFAAAKAGGAKLIDIGCMQINAHYHAMHFASLGAMFDPRRNVDYAANFLKSLKAEVGTWTLAVARYNAGPRQPGGGAHLRLRRHPQHGRERLRPMDRQRPGALPVARDPIRRRASFFQSVRRQILQFLSSQADSPSLGMGRGRHSLCPSLF
jgi:soluble lytic murein transglycosylase-like protein